jgi:hypothetical protein
MPENLTPVDEFTADVPVPLGGDARTAASVRSAFQALTNRTEHHELHKLSKSEFNSTVAGALFTITSGVVSAGDHFPIGGSSQVGGTFSVASNEITVPAVGAYALFGAIALGVPNTSPFEKRVEIFLNGVLWSMYSEKVESSEARWELLPLLEFVIVPNVAHKISLRAPSTHPMSVAESSASRSRIMLVKIGPQVTP